MKTLHMFTNIAEGMTARVFAHTKGFSVALRDDDSGETLPEIRIYPTEERAVNAAQRLVNSREAVYASAPLR